MKRYAVKDLKINTFFTESVFLDDKYIILAPDIPITPDLINRLSKWGYREILSDGVCVNTPPDLKSGETHQVGVAVLEKNIEEQHAKSEIVEFYAGMVSFLGRIFAVYKKTQEINIKEITERIKNLITVVKSRRKHILKLPELDPIGDNYIVNHSVRTAILTLAIADYLKLPTHKQIEAGIAALLHEIGMLKIPEQIYQSPNPLGPKELQAVMVHPILGFNILKTANVPLDISVSVLEHHERLDGSGYPRKLTGDKISLYGKLLAVTCSYDAATSKRPYKNENDGHTGIMNILKSTGSKYDETIVKSLIFIMSLYPLGTHVVLSNFMKGVVIETNIDAPKQPIILLLTDEKNEAFTQRRIVNLKESKDLSIVRIMTQGEIKTLD